MMNRKVVSIAAALLTTTVILAGCGSTPAKTDAPAAKPEAAAAKPAYPQKEITLIIPWAAGGGTDLIGRQIAQLAEKELGKPIIVENKTGGGGVIGFQEIAKAKPDGYTIGFISNSLILQKYASSAFVDYHQFAPISLVNEDPASLTVKADSPYKTLGDFLAAAKANPGKLTIANSGPGAVWHVAGLDIEKVTGNKFKHVPYDGANPAGVAVAGGHADATTASPAEVLSLVDGGQLRVLAVAAPQRMEKFPNVPTFKEAGADMVFGVWRGFVAPKGTPAEIVDALNKAFEKAVNSQEYKDFMKRGSYGIRYMNAKDFTTYMGTEDNNYADLFKGLDLKK